MFSVDFDKLLFFQEMDSVQISEDHTKQLVEEVEEIMETVEVNSVHSRPVVEDSVSQNTIDKDKYDVSKSCCVYHG